MLDLDLLPESYAVCRLPAGTPLPGNLPGDGGVVAITWTDSEVSIICPADRVPPGAQVETQWRCMRVAGTMELALAGILNSLTNPLAEARVNICAFSTYDTDYLLVPEVRLTEAVAVLTGAGHRIKET
ncbi:MAG: ACT domain-containing protein [Micromonosporaceae bacterium]